ncbi:MAG: FtsW/RodA/SpoVE family cell cycle protein [Roseburia sp.]
MLKQYKLRDYHFRLVFYVIALTILGIFVIGSAEESVQNKQIVGLILGTAVMVGVSLINYNFILRFSWIIYGIAVFLLLLIFTPLGYENNGSTRWLQIGIRFQPSEMAKILIILFFAYYLTKHQEHLNTIKVLFSSFVLAGIPLLLIYKEPDLSTTIVTALIIVSLLFLAGLSYKIVLGAIAVTVPTISVLITLILQPNQTILTSNQAMRILGWLQPEKYPNTAYQQQNSITAIGSGQLIGKGLNNTDIASVKNGNFISEPQTDFIFAIVGEELGFIGTVTVIVLLLLITIECLLIARKAKNMSGRLIAGGIASLIGFQSFVNICVVTGLMPNTGLPLPFVSYGLTSLVTLFAGIGIVLNVGLQPRKYGKEDSFS